MGHQKPVWWTGVSPFTYKIKTASGAAAVQIVSKFGGVHRIVEHLGSAYDETRPEVLLEAGRQKIAAWQDQEPLDLKSLEPTPGCTGLATTTVESGHSRLLRAVLHGAYQRLSLGEAVGGDQALGQTVLIRLAEPSSKAQVPRVLSNLGLEVVTVRALFRSLTWAQKQDYRGSLSNALFEHVTTSRSLALCLYDTTTLRFEAEKEDGLRRVGYSKEWRVDPQVIVGLLVSRRGFPLRIGCWEGNKAETTIIIPVVEAFQAAYSIEELVIVADAGILSATNLTALGDTRLCLIVGARQVRVPGDLEAHSRWAGDAFADGWLIDTITPRRDSNTEWDKSLRAELAWDPDTHPGSWRAVQVYSKKRAARDAQTLTAQVNRVRAVIAGERRPKGTGFVIIHQGDQVLNRAFLTRAKSLVGPKDYVTNTPPCLMGAGEVVSSYHELWHVERSFRMSKHGLRARPVFHHTRSVIEAHPTVVMAASAVARHIQETAGISIRRIIHTLKSLQDATINLNGHKITVQLQITPTVASVLGSLQSPGH